MVRPGGRTESNRKAVADAVLSLLTEGNLLFDVQDIANLSGVHRTTVRRRWPNRDALIAAAMSEHTSRMHIDLSGDWKTVLRRIAFGLRDFLHDPVEDALNRFIAISASEDFVRLVRVQWQRVYDHLAEPFVKAQRQGQLSAKADVQMMLRALAGTILTRAVYSRARVEDSFIEQLAAQLMIGLQPGPAAGPQAKRKRALKGK